MKKIVALLIMSILLLSLAACDGTKNGGSMVSTSQAEPAPAPTEAQGQSSELAQDISPTPASTPESSETEPEETATKALVVYFSATGNTETVAKALAEAQGAGLYEIVPEQPYTDEDLNYSDRSSRSTTEQNDDTARPAIFGSIENMESYEVVYVGFPIWWGDMPRILYTFFDSYDLSSKTIAPFCTSGGSGISQAVQSVAGLEPDATITEGLRTSASGAESDIVEWLAQIGLAE